MREERRRSVSRGRRERRSVKIRRNAGGNLETPGTWGWWSLGILGARRPVRMASANRGVDPCHQKEKGMLKKCAFEECGNWFESTNARRLFCSERCRRQGQNATRRALRAELRDAREHLRPMEDPWARGPADASEAEDVWANALLDALPVGAESLNVAQLFSVRARGSASRPGAAAGRYATARPKASGSAPRTACRNASGSLRQNVASASGAAGAEAVGCSDPAPRAEPRATRSAEDQLFPSA